MQFFSGKPHEKNTLGGTQITVEKGQDESIKERIPSLLEKGYARAQLIKDFEFAERTVDSAIKEYRKNPASSIL